VIFFHRSKPARHRLGFKRKVVDASGAQRVTQKRQPPKGESPRGRFRKEKTQQDGILVAGRRAGFKKVRPKCCKPRPSVKETGHTRFRWSWRKDDGRKGGGRGPWWEKNLAFDDQIGGDRKKRKAWRVAWAQMEKSLR